MIARDPWPRGASTRAEARPGAAWPEGVSNAESHGRVKAVLTHRDVGMRGSI